MEVLTRSKSTVGKVFHSWETNNMRQTARGLVEATMIVASWLADISQSTLMPIEKFVDWLEGVYAGPMGPDQSF
jgi:hypothetical protein